MYVLVEFNIVPIGVGVSISRYVAECHNVFKNHDLKTQLHAFGTNAEGPWDEVMQAVKECHQVLHELGAARLLSSMKISTRTDRDQGLVEKVEAVEKHQDS